MNIKIVREKQTEIETALFYIFWTVLMGGNAAGYTLGNRGFRYICYASVLLLFIKFLISDYARKERFVCKILLALGILIWHFSGRVAPFLTLLAITSMKNMDYQKVVKFTFWLTGILFVVKTSLAMAGVIDIGKRVLSTGRVRYRLGYDHPNVVQEILFLIIVSCILVYHQQLRIYHYLALEFYNYLIYCYTDSRTGFAVISICIVLSWVAGQRKAGELLYGMVKRLADKAFLIVILLNILVTFLYSAFIFSETGPSDPYDTLSLRFWNTSVLINNHSLNLFGIPEVEPVDGMLNVIYGNGLLFMLLFLCGYYLLLRKHCKKEDIYFMITCCCYALYGIVEATPVSVLMNITLPALSGLIFKEQV